MTEAERLYLQSVGCGCCTETDGPEWPDVEKALREQIAKEIEGLYHDDRENTCRKDNCIPCMIVDSAVAIARGNND
jgi:hypothetical protein